MPKHKPPMLAFSIIVLSLFVFHVAYAEEIVKDLGKVTDIVLDGQSVYFFEVDDGIAQKSTWIKDTRVAKHELSENNEDHQSEMMVYLSQEHFMFPSEMAIFNDYLIFTVLSEDCVGQIQCDFQDVVILPKNTAGEKSETVADHLRANVHLAILKADVANDKENSHNDTIKFYASESSGRIWEIVYDVATKTVSKDLVWAGENIIIDLVYSDDDSLYWIEETSDLEYLLFEKVEGPVPTIIYRTYNIPHSFKSIGDKLYWKETTSGRTQKEFPSFQTEVISFDPIKARVMMADGVGGYDAVQKSMKTIAEYKNTPSIPISLNESYSHYGPTFVTGQYVILVNNTKNPSTIHLMDITNRTTYDIGTVSGGEVKFMQAQENFLYTVEQSTEGKDDETGTQKDSFAIKRYHLPVAVPEFPLMYVSMLATVPIFISLILVRVLYPSLQHPMS